MKKLVDGYNRPHDYLRISLTDRCNLNCLYCNPLNKTRTYNSGKYILSNEEILRLVRLFVTSFGFRKIRFTGGEPLIRKDFFNLMQQVNELKEFHYFETAVTTNGTLLKGNLVRLKETGIEKLNISLDTLNKDKFKLISGRDNFDSVFEAISDAAGFNFQSLKINVVIIKGINDNEIVDFVKFAMDNELNVRFIEFMPFGNNFWNEEGFISSNEIIQKVKSEFELIEVRSNHVGVAKNFNIKNKKGTVGFISSISNHFCNNCNRLRITSDGKLKLCLFSPQGNDLNLKEILSDTRFNDDDLAFIIESSLKHKSLSHPGVEELLRLEKNNMLSIGG